MLLRHRGFEPRTTWLKVKCSANWANTPYLICKTWASWIRTSECRSQSPVPYRLAIAHHFFRCWTYRIKGGYRDSNPGPPEPQSGALTNCAIPTITCSKGFEPPTHGLEGRCSIQLSYRLIMLFRKSKAGDGNRTHVSSLEGWCSTIELHPHACGNKFTAVGVTGFEPAASWSQTRRSSQAEPHPVIHNIHFCITRDARHII